MKKFFTELDYPFLFLILYIIKSIFLINPIDLGVIVLLSITFVLHYSTKQYLKTKVTINNDVLSHDKFKFIEELSERNFQKKIIDQLEQLDKKLTNKVNVLDEDVSSVKQSLNLRNGYKK